MADSFAGAVDTMTEMAEKPENSHHQSEKDCLVACAQTLLLVLPEVNRLHNFQEKMEDKIDLTRDLEQFATVEHKFDSLRDRIQSLEESVDSLVERLSSLELAVNDKHRYLMACVSGMSERVALLEAHTGLAMAQDIVAEAIARDQEKG